MVLEATMVCLDNSEWMRNGDYRSSRFAEQANAAAIVSSLKMQANLESTVGVLTMAGRSVSVLVMPTNDIDKILARMHGLEIGGEANLVAAIKVAQLVLKNRQNKQQQQRIIVFVGSPVLDTKNELEAIGKILKKSNVALDVVDFGESEYEKPEKLEALVAAVSTGGNSHIIHVPPGEDFLSDAILSSPMFADVQESGFAARAYGFQFDEDPEMELALQLSMAEERARQEAASEKAAEESSETESTSQCSTLSYDIIMADAELEPTPCTDDQRNMQMDEEDQLLQQAHVMSIEDGSPITLQQHVADEVDLVLQMSVPEEETGTLSDTSKVLGDQTSVQSISYALPGVDHNDLCTKDLQEWHELLIGPREAEGKRKLHRKQKKKQLKKQQRKREEKHDGPEGGKSQ